MPGPSATADGRGGDAKDTGKAKPKPACVPEEAHAVVTDIDATLTTSDGQLGKQIRDPDYDQTLCAGGPELLPGQAERGYWVVYVTARGDDQKLTGSDVTMRDATEHPRAAPRVVAGLYRGPG